MRRESAVAGYIGAAAKGAREMVGALFAIPLVLLFSFAIWQYGLSWLHAARSGIDIAVHAAAALLTLGVAVAFLFVVLRKKPFVPVLFLACSITMSAVMYAAYIHSIDVVWVSDFETMWQHAARMVGRSDYTVTSVYDERALPVIVPAMLLFGANRAAIPVINLILLLAIQLAGYDLARRMHGHRAAQAFVVLWVGAMEPIFALPITSHDLWGLFFLVAFLWGFRALRDLNVHDVAIARWWRRALAIVGSVVLAFLLVLLDLQRELVPIIFLGFLLGIFYVAIKAEGRTRAVVSLASVSFVLYLGMAAWFKHENLMQSDRQGERLAQIRTGAYGSSLANGTYSQGQVLWKEFFLPLKGAERQDLVLAVPISDFTLQPLSRIGNILKRSYRQAALGSQTNFYQAEAQTQWAGLIPLTRAYNRSYVIMVSLLGLVSVLFLLRRHRSYDGIIQLGILSTLTGTLVLSGESQPRYLFPLWFFLAQLIAFAASERDGMSLRGRVWAVAGFEMARGLLLLFAGYLLLALATKWIYTEAHGRVLGGWKATVVNAKEPVRQNWFAVHQKSSGSRIARLSKDSRGTVFGDLALVLKLPGEVAAGGGISVEKKLCVGQERRSLDFFYYMPHRDPELTAGLKLEILVNGRLLKSFRWSKKTKAKHVKIPDILPAEECGVLQLKLVADRKPAVGRSVDASQVDLYFMRLVR